MPATQFGLATWSTGKVCPDIHVKVGPARYSVPWPLIGQRVQAHANRDRGRPVTGSFRTIKGILAAGTEAGGAGPGPSATWQLSRRSRAAPSSCSPNPTRTAWPTSSLCPTTTGPTTTAGAGDLDCQAVAVTGQPAPEPTIAVRWEMDPEQAGDLADVLGLFEDFLRQASCDAVDELARLPITRPPDPSRWADSLADYLGDQGSALRAATRAATDATSTGDLS
ncbi:MAG: Mu transposase domain-containing protein [Geodermatophilaceae bacterium]